VLIFGNICSRISITDAVLSELILSIRNTEVTFLMEVVLM